MAKTNIARAGSEMALLFCQNSKLLLICLTFSSRKDLSISPSCHVFHSCLIYLHRAPHRPSSAMTNFSPKFIYTTPHGALLCPLLPYLPILLLSPLPLLGVFISYAGHWRFKVSADKSDSVKQKRLSHCTLFFGGFLFHMQGISYCKYLL